MRTAQTERRYATASPVDEGEGGPTSTRASQGQQGGWRGGSETGRTHASYSTLPTRRASADAFYLRQAEVAIASLQSDVESLKARSKQQKREYDRKTRILLKRLKQCELVLAFK